MTVAFVSHPDCTLHQTHPHHPEAPERLSAIQDRLISSGLDFVLRHFDAPAITRAGLLRVHDPAYLDSLLDIQIDEGWVWLDADTALGPHTLRAALRAAGAGPFAVDRVLGGDASAAFCAVRPPGHHAESDRPMGTCLFNNVAITAAHALEAHGLERVAVVDFDVHHGNGTEAILGSDPRVLLCSAFQHPFYPHTAFAVDRANIRNVPLPANTDGQAFRAALDNAGWWAALESFAPQIILVSAGFDGHYEDDMAFLKLTEADYRWLTHRIKAVADRVCEGRIVSLLEGGYSLSALGRSVGAHLDVLLGQAS